MAPLVLLGFAFSLLATPLHAEPLAGKGIPTPESPALGRAWVRTVVPPAEQPQLALKLQHALVDALHKHTGYLVRTERTLRAELNKAIAQHQLGGRNGSAAVAAAEGEFANLNLAASFESSGGDQTVHLTLTAPEAPAGLRQSLRPTTNWAGIEEQLGYAVTQLLSARPSSKAVPPAATALQSEPPRAANLHLALWEFEVTNEIPKASRSLLEAALVHELLNMPEVVQVSTRADIKKQVTKTEFEALLGCDRNLRCIPELGDELGISEMVTGTIGKLKGGGYGISLSWLDVDRKGEVFESVLGDEKTLENSLRFVAHQLMGHDHSSDKGSLHLTFNTPSGIGEVGARPFVLSNSVLKLGALSPGTHRLTFRPEDKDYLPTHMNVYVPVNGGLNERRIELEFAPTPFYRNKTVLLSAAGVATAIAAIVAGAVILPGNEVTIRDSRNSATNAAATGAQ